MLRWLIIALVSLMVCGGAKSASAQEPGIELQVGPGYIHDFGDGPSTPTASVGAILWFGSHVGLGGRVSLDIRDNPSQAPNTVEDRVSLGPDKARQSAIMLQFRSFEGGSTEVNVGLGLSAVSYQDETILTGVSPRTLRERIGTEAIRTELFLGRNLTPRISLKGGFSFDLTGDVHPFQPMVLVGFRL